MVVTKLTKENIRTLRSKLFSPLYLAVMTIGVIILGNFMTWADTVYGTHFHVINPFMVLLTVILFGMYLYSIRSEYKKHRRK